MEFADFPDVPPVDPGTPVIPQPASSSSGGLCSYNPNGRFDPVLPGLVLIGLAYLGLRREKKRAE